ncbi:phage tail protein [Helicobacter typhlonius]|uniref:phage tail protein n=1 Tax=Helicobacter typhlonius TaxID=76936 RepID=UPI002FE213AF
MTAYTKELPILESLFIDVIDNHFKLPSHYFYNPEQNTSNLQHIANTFDIDIKDESEDSIKIELCQKPILKKSKLGTYNGIKEAVFGIFGEINIQTHATKENLEPFNFEIQIEPTTTNIIDLKKAQRLIEKYKPLRDSFTSITINFPQAQIPTHIATLANFGVSFNKTTRLYRNTQAITFIEPIALWKLTL